MCLFSVDLAWNFLCVDLDVCFLSQIRDFSMFNIRLRGLINAPISFYYLCSSSVISTTLFHLADLFLCII